MAKKAISLDNLATFKEQYDLLLEGSLSGKQDTLVSGENIKTINNQSILGSGNIEIQGGGTIDVDDHIDNQSTNPVENRVIADALDGKEDNIQDLADIRSGAALGATAVQPEELPPVFVAKYGVTTHIEIEDAFANGYGNISKAALCEWNGKAYILSGGGNWYEGEYVFSGIDYDYDYDAQKSKRYLVTLVCGINDVWSNRRTLIPTEDDIPPVQDSEIYYINGSHWDDEFAAVRSASISGKCVVFIENEGNNNVEQKIYTLTYANWNSDVLFFTSVEISSHTCKVYWFSATDITFYSDSGSFTVPTSLSELSDDSTHRLVTDTEKATWNGKYTKPASGIPSTDMESAVQTSLGKADTAVQPAALQAVTDLIPAQASSENQLADKNFVNSSVSTATATFRGTFTSLQTLQATNGDKNDYAFYNHTDSAGNAIYDRYKYVGPPVDRLPDGYTEMLYLRKGLNVTAYIDTGIKIQSTDKIYIKCYGWQYEATEYVAFGASDSNGKYFRFNKQYLGGAAFVQTSTGSISAANLYNDSAIIECYDGKVYSSDIYGENKTLKGNLTLETVDNNFFLFAYNDGINNTISRYPQQVDIGDFVVYDQNGNKKLELIPCSNNLDAIGYYDTVSETFIAPTGDGLTAQALPTDKWLYEYSLNNSSFTSTQWASINSGITGTAVTKLSNLPTKPVDTAVQSLSAAEQLQARTNIGATAPEIFFATYGTTTYADALAAHDAGKVVVCMRDNGLVYVLSYCTSTDLRFAAWNVNTCHVVTLSSSDVWTTSSFIAEITANRVTSWQQTPSDTKYPSEKLVKDSLDAKQPTIDANNKLDYSLLDNAPGVADASNLGLVKVDKNAGGINKDSNGKLILDVASDTEIAAKTTVCALKVRQIDKAVQVGITTNANTLSASEKAAAQSWLGLSGKEDSSNKVTSLSSSSTDTQYPSAKATYDNIHPAVESSQPVGGFAPNILYNLGTLSANTTFALATPSDANIVNHYYWTFDTSSTAPTITWPSGITWFGGSAPTIAASKHYEISVLGGIGAFMEV